MAKPLTTEECRELNAVITSGELVESEEAANASYRESLKQLAIVRATAAKPKPRKPRGLKKTTALVHRLIDKGITDVDDIQIEVEAQTSERLTPGNIRKIKSEYAESLRNVIHSAPRRKKK